MANYNINVIVNPSGAERGTRKVRSELKKTEDSANSLRKSIGRAFAFAGGAAILTGSIRLLADFSQSMSTVKAISGATEQQFKSLREEALKLGASTRFSATQAGDAMLFLARAGFDASQVLEGVGSTLLLAQAGALELGRAADISSNVLQGFRLEVSDLDKVVDVLALTANSSNTNIQQMGIAMQFVAPVAAGLGVSVEEASAAIGSLSNAGLQASLAGTGLRRVLSELESPSKGSVKILNSLGVSTEEVAISQVGLTSALRRLKSAGIDTGQALELFGDRGGPAFEVLQQAIPDIVELNSELLNAEGTAKKIAETMDQNLNGALLALKSSLQNVVLQFGELGAQSGLTVFVRGMTSALRNLATNLDEVIRLATVAGIVISVNLVKKGILLAVAAVKSLNLAIRNNPFGALAFAITLVVSELIVFSDMINLGGGSLATLEDLAISAFTFIKRSLVELEDITSGVFETIKALSGEVFSTVGSDGKKGFEIVSSSAVESFSDIDLSLLGLIKALALMTDRFVGVFLGWFNAVVLIFDQLPIVIREKFIDMFNGIQNLIEKRLNLLVTLINKITSFNNEFSLFQIPQIDPVSFSDIENIYEGAGAKLSEAMTDGYLDAFDFNVFRGALESVVLGAEDIARNRIANDEKNKSTGGGSIETLPTPELATNQETNLNSSFAKLLKELENDYQIEAELLGKTNAQREIANGLINIESELKRELSNVNVGGIASEREQVTVLLENIQALENQADIYGFLKAPQEEYMETLSAINQLLKDNKISQIEANVALQDTQLSRALTDVQGSINPEEEETRRLADQLQERQLIVQQSIEAGLLMKEEGFALSLELERNHAESIAEIQRSQASFALNSAQGTFESLAGITEGFVGKQSGAYKVLFGISKAFAIADATVKIQAAIANAFNATTIAQGLTQAAIVVGQTSKIISTIQGTQFEGGFQSGGAFKVGGSGGPDTQHVSFMATPGERVSIETPQQQKASSSSSQAESNGVNILNVVDPNMVEDYLSSPGGEKTYINFIQRNANSVKAAIG